VRYLIWAVLLVPVAFFVGACLRDPLDSPGDGTALKGSAAYNTFCYVCHLNFKKEKLALRHARAGVGCTKCHGNSEDHSADEDNVTPPEIMYAKKKINPSCTKCHKPRELARKSQHKPVLAGTAKHKKYCTDCHGDHRVAVRTRRWNKDTGKLIADDGVRMVHPTTRPSTTKPAS